MLLLQAGGGGGGGSLAGSPAAGGGGPGGCATIMLDLNVPNIISNYAGGTGSYFPSNIVASKCCFRITLGTGGAGGGANSNGSTGGASYIELCY